MSNRTLFRKSGLANYCEKIFVAQKLNNWVGYSFIALIAVGFGYLLTHQMKFGLGVIGMLCSLPVVLVCLFNTEFGFYTTVVFSFFAFLIMRIFFAVGIDLPVGILFDALVVVTFLSLFIRQGQSLKKKLNEITENPAIIFLLFIYAFFLLQLFNPNAHSTTGWYMGFRKLLSNLLLLFISYNVFNTKKDIRKFIIYFFVLSLLSAIHGCIQELNGLYKFEMDWLLSDPHGAALAFIGGQFRKFGTMSDPAAYGMNMALSAIFFLVVLLGKFKNFSLFIVVAVGIVIMLTAMSYSGTRTANAMIVAGACFYILLTANRRSSYIFAVVGATIFLLLLYGPFNSQAVQRFRSTFSPEEDASYNVREKNRKNIQYYIHSHPIGGGLATTGGIGKTYHPGHPLAGFQPDNGYLKRALETGYIGFINYLIFYFLIFRTGIRGYFQTKDPESKIIYGGILCVFFCFYIGEYAQKATGQLTSVILYYPMIAIILKLRKFDSSSPEKEKQYEISPAPTT